MHSKGAIKINNLTVSYADKVIIQNLSVDFPAGKIIGLLGPNGTGKTTLIRSIVGRLKVRQGSITIFGQPAGSSKLRSQIGYMTQAPAVYPDLTVKENLRYFGTMFGQSEHQINSLINELELDNKASQLVSNLSGGQRSRVSMAVALLGHPKLLVLDEPTVGLDPLLRVKMWKLFKALADKGSTILVSSHVLDEANHCDYLMFLRDGQLLAYTTPHQLLSDTDSKTVEESFIKLTKERRA